MRIPARRTSCDHGPGVLSKLVLGDIWLLIEGLDNSDSTLLNRNGIDNAKLGADQLAVIGKIKNGEALVHRPVPSAVREAIERRMRFYQAEMIDFRQKRAEYDRKADAYRKKHWPNDRTRKPPSKLIGG